MRAIKNGLCMLLTAVLITVLLSGCQSGEYGLDRTKPVMLSVWHYYNGAQKELFDQLVNEFNDTIGTEKGIVVEAYSQGSVTDLQTKVMESIEKKVGAQEMPDIFAAYADTAYTVNEMGLLADVGAYMSEEELSAYVDAYVEEGRLGEGSGLKIFPIAKSTEAFFLNKTDWDKFAAATGASTDAFSTWEGIAKVAEDYYNWSDGLTPEPDDGKAFFGRDAMANYLLIGSLQLGEEILQIKNGKATLNLKEDVLRKLWDNYYIPYINGYYASYGRFRSDDAKTGDIIAFVGATSGSTYFPKEVTNPDGSTYAIEGTVYPLPNFEGTEPCAVQQGAGMVVTKSDETREYAATVFLKWCTKKENNVLFSVRSGYLPVTKEANTFSAVTKAMGGQVSGLVKDTVEVGVSIVSTYRLYTPLPFENGVEIRALINSSLQDKSAADRAAVEKLIAGGASRQAAVAQFNTDENFKQWMASFQIQLEGQLS